MRKQRSGSRLSFVKARREHETRYLKHVSVRVFSEFVIT